MSGRRRGSSALRLAMLGLLLLAVQASGAAAQRSQAEPEAATGWRTRPVLTARRHMVVAANRYAADAGREMLRAGGNAVDAAIAAVLVLGLVEPQSSGLGGGAFLVMWDARTRALTSYDGRETAPAAARPDRFMRDGAPMSFDSAVRSGLSVGTPGLVRLLETVHRKHGRLEWARVLAPAITLADKGFIVSPRLAALIASEGAERFAPGARRYFFDAQGRPHAAGHRLANPTYAAVLRRIAREGAAAFYDGAVAQAIVDAVAAAKGDLTRADLAAYAVRERPVVCAPYRGNRVCGMGPPSSGAIAVGQALMLLDGFDVGRTPADALAPRGLHLLAEATKLAFADRGRYIADPEAVRQPTGLLDPRYIIERRRLIDPARGMGEPAAGVPPDWRKTELPGHDATLEASGTTHLSIVDREGTAVAMTATVEAGFGSRLWASGFLLNNQLTDFSFRPVDRDGAPIANSVAPGKRPRSSMAPTIVLDAQGRPWIVAGSPGGSRIIPYVIKALVGIIDWRLDAGRAVALPNYATRGGDLELEPQTPAASRQGLARDFGQRIAIARMTSGLHIIVRRPGGLLEGGVDPRREGAALGD